MNFFLLWLKFDVLCNEKKTQVHMIHINLICNDWMHQFIYIYYDLDTHEILYIHHAIDEGLFDRIDVEWQNQ